ncbi:MAG: hypothetical protein ACYSR0_09605 [Planctomycetota bacterium]|jgi:hypothetical protein
MIGQLLNKFNKRAIIFSCIAMVILMVIVLDRLSFGSFFQSINNMDEELSLKKDLLIKYNTTISMKDSYEKKLNAWKDSYNFIENRLFQCKTEDLAQAKLQEFVKNVARQNGLIVSRSSTQKGEIINDDPHLMLVYAKVEINDIDKIKKLQIFLYNIEYEQKNLIFIDDLKLRSSGFEISRGVSVSITLFTIAKLETKA